MLEKIIVSTIVDRYKDTNVLDLSVRSEVSIYDEEESAYYECCALARVIFKPTEIIIMLRQKVQFAFAINNETKKDSKSGSNEFNILMEITTINYANPKFFTLLWLWLDWAVSKEKQREKTEIKSNYRGKGKAIGVQVSAVRSETLGDFVVSTSQFELPPPKSDDDEQCQ